MPRLGAPGQIIALKDQPFVVLIYSTREIRIVPTDGRNHNLINVAAETWNGDPVGHWEGNTRSSSRWFHRAGWRRAVIHSFR